VSYMAILMIFRFCTGRKNEKKRERWSQGEGRREELARTAAGCCREGWRCAGGVPGGGCGPGGGIWLLLNQSI
jgi:hypothetical protein